MGINQNRMLRAEHYQTYNIFLAHLPSKSSTSRQRHRQKILLQKHPTIHYRHPGGEKKIEGLKHSQLKQTRGSYQINNQQFLCLTPDNSYNKEINIHNGIESKTQQILSGLILPGCFSCSKVSQFQSNCTLNRKHSWCWYKVEL